jgi:hypothetical protein
VSHSTKNPQHELLQELYKPKVLDNLLRESKSIVARRKVAGLNKAEECVQFHLSSFLWTYPNNHAGLLLASSLSFLCGFSLRL